MKKILLMILFLAAPYFIDAQNNINSSSKSDEVLRTQNHQSSVTKTLLINTSGYPSKTFRDFQKELKGWSGKVTYFNNDTILKTFTLTHSLLLHPKEFEEFLNKYYIKSSSIISYQ
ncbi:MAG: hypothetical protein U0W65_09160 [Bacteroidia bacterium]